MSKFKIGDRVKLNPDTNNFAFGKAGVSYDEIGIVTSINTIRIDVDYTVNFPSHAAWNGLEDELILAEISVKELLKPRIHNSV